MQQERDKQEPAGNEDLVPPNTRSFSIPEQRRLHEEAAVRVMERKTKTRILGIIGIVFGFLALAAAFLSPWLGEALDPPKPTAEERVVDFAFRIAEAAKAKAKGEDYTPANVSKPRPSRHVFPSIIAMGLIAAGLGIASLLASEPRMLGIGALALGLGAIAVQWSILILASIFAVVIILALLSYLMDGFPDLSF